MQVFESVHSIHEALIKIKTKQSIGFVPTMGALHQGHLSLIEKARSENDRVVVSIFVNPTQFDKAEDLLHYPRTLESDLALLEESGCDYVFAPTPEDIYNSDIKSLRFNFGGLESAMEGKHRKGHFDGVATIVKKLFEIVVPDTAYFGEKDFQQLQIIKKLVAQYKLPVKIIACPIYREMDGLAMSSRNTRLTPEQRNEAPFIYKTLKKARQLFKDQSIDKVIAWVENEFKNNPVLSLEYFEIADSTSLQSAKRKSKKARYRAFIAVYADTIRLIDNIALN